MLESAKPPHAIDTTQFANTVQNQYRHVVNGRDPVQAAEKVDTAWYRLDPIETALNLPEREGQVFVNALDKGAEVLDEAARESRTRARRKLGETALSLRIDAMQTGLVLSATDKGAIAKQSSEVLEGLRDNEKRTLRDGRELLYSDMFDILNVKALNIQAQAETARSMTGALAGSSRAIVQASLGGFVQECTGYLRRIGDINDDRRKQGKDASLPSGRFTELAIFTKRLLDWYDAGATEGDMVRFTVGREDKPRLDKNYSQTTKSKLARRSFDIVTRDAFDPTSAVLLQVKTSQNIGGARYDEPIELWHPPRTDIADHAQEIAGAFETIIGNQNEQDIRSARLQLATYLG